MTTHATLIDAAVWPADLVSAGVVASAAQVYSGARWASPATSNGEVWLERLGVEEQGRGLQGVRHLAYLVHYRQAVAEGTAREGKPAVDAVEAKLRAIVARYHGKRPFVSAVPSIKAASAIEDRVLVDPEDKRFAEGTVRVTFLEAD